MLLTSNDQPSTPTEGMLPLPNQQSNIQLPVEHAAALKTPVKSTNPACRVISMLPPPNQQSNTHLCVGHAAALKPAVKHVVHTAQRAFALAARDGEVVDEVAVQVSDLGTCQLLQLRDAAHHHTLLAVLGLQAYVPRVTVEELRERERPQAAWGSIGGKNVGGNRKAHDSPPRWAEVCPRSVSERCTSPAHPPASCGTACRARAQAPSMSSA
eukprot:scaffold13105_cov21-Tisochrysis_lutea.AAC.1